MTTLRCTARLLKALRIKPGDGPPTRQSRLGDWTANLIHVLRIQLVVAVSEPTRLGIAPTGNHAVTAGDRSSAPASPDERSFSVSGFETRQR